MAKQSRSIMHNVHLILVAGCNENRARSRPSRAEWQLAFPTLLERCEVHHADVGILPMWVVDPFSGRGVVLAMSAIVGSGLGLGLRHNVQGVWSVLGCRCMLLSEDPYRAAQEASLAELVRREGTDWGFEELGLIM